MERAVKRLSVAGVSLLGLGRAVAGASWKRRGWRIPGAPGPEATRKGEAAKCRTRALEILDAAPRLGDGIVPEAGSARAQTRPTITQQPVSQTNATGSSVTLSMGRVGIAGEATVVTNVYDLVADYSATQNPNGPWTYGGIFQRSFCDLSF